MFFMFQLCKIKPNLGPRNTSQNHKRAPIAPPPPWKKNPESEGNNQAECIFTELRETCVAAVATALLKYAGGVAAERQTEADGCVVPESAGPDFTQFDELNYLTSCRWNVPNRPPPFPPSTPPPLPRRHACFIYLCRTVQCLP